MRVLVDTSALIALALSRDQHSARARAIVRQRSPGREYIGTTAILTEFHRHLLYVRGPAEARVAIDGLLNDPIHTWMPVSDMLIASAVANWLVRFSDQAFSLADAVSFEVMRREKITHAFAFDHHFEIAGFQLLR